MLLCFVLWMTAFTMATRQPIDIPPELIDFRHNKTIPSVIEKNVLKALSHYPELKDTDIRFVFKQSLKGSVMAARPVFGSLLRKKKNRAYQILISSTFRLPNTIEPIHQIPDSVMIGWIGHELGHIMDYEERSSMGVIGFGFGYVFSRKYVRKAERIADIYAVEHGMADYIIATKNFILDHAELPQAYKDKIARLYLSPDDIVELVTELEEEERDAIKQEMIQEVEKEVEP